MRRAAAAFDQDWSDYFLIESTDDVVRAAGNAAERHSLSGADALHLASALALRDASPGETIQLATWDTRLWDAASTEAFRPANPRPA